MEIKFKRYELATGEFTTATIETNHNVVDCLFTGIQDDHGIDAYAGDTVSTPRFEGVIEYRTDLCCWIIRRPDNTFVRLEIRHMCSLNTSPYFQRGKFIK